MGFEYLFQNPRYWDEDYVPFAKGGWSLAMRTSQEKNRGEQWRQKLSRAKMGKYRNEHFGYLPSGFANRRSLVLTNGFWKHIESPLRDEWQRLHPKHYDKHHVDYDKHKRLKSLYGLSKETFDEMVKDQDGKCAMCGKPPIGNWLNYGIPRGLEVDHNHQSGKVRALLCQHCNKVLGQYEAWHEQCEAYLRRFSNG